MKYKMVALLLTVSALFFLFACAHVSGPGSNKKTAVLHVPECLE
jgi:hypothetical protein